MINVHSHNNDKYSKYLKYKQKYLSLTKQYGGRITNEQESIADGAGVILAEYYENKHNDSPNTKINIALILFKNSKSNMFDVLGGHKDPTDPSTKHTAIREAKEESANTIRLSTSSLNSSNAIMHSHNNHNYACYFVGIKQFKPSYYRHNLKLLQNTAKTIDHVWLETNDVTRVYIESFIKSGGLTKHGNLMLYDVNDKLITITDKTKSCIREALNYGILPDPTKKSQNGTLSFINLRVDHSYEPKNIKELFLSNTKCFYTH